MKIIIEAIIEALVWGVLIVAICVLLAGCTVRVDARWADSDARGYESGEDRHQLENILEDTSELYEDDELKQKRGE